MERINLNEFTPNIGRVHRMNQQNKLYFAHSYKLWGTPQEKNWMRCLQEKFPDHEIINPFDGESGLVDKFGGMEYYEKAKKFGINSNLREHAKAIVIKDISTLDQCNTIVAFVQNKRQIGTLWEIVHALFTDKKIYVICKQPSPFFIGTSNVTWYPSPEEFFWAEFHDNIEDPDFDDQYPEE